MVVKPEDQCMWVQDNWRCPNNGTEIVVGREGKHKKAGVYCDAHGKMVLREGHPEYEVRCPNCTCLFGVN